jgi:hypothetical protein
VRLIHASALSSAPVFAVLLGDSKRYVDWASEIAAGDWIGTEVFYQAPLYPYLLAVAFKAFGVSIDLVKILQALAGAVACVLVAMAGRRFFDWRVGLIAGAALALYPPAIFFDGHIQKSSIDLLLMAALTFAVAAYVSDRRTRGLVMLGAVLGCLILNRENARLLFPFLAVWLFVWNRDLPVARRLQAVAVFTLAVLLPTAPVAIRNYYVGGEVMLSTSQLGPNFYIGNHAGASGVYEPLVPDRSSVIFEREDAVRLAAAALGRPLSASEVSGYWLSAALDDIRRDPAAWARLMVKKLLLSVNTVESPDTESLEFHAGYSPILRLLRPFTFGVLLPLAVLGIALTASDFRRLAVLYGIAVVFIGSVVLFFVMARYRYPVVPVLVLFAAAAIVEFPAAWRRRRQRALVGLACAAALALVVNTPLRVSTDETYGNFGAALLKLDRPREAIPFLERAVELLPDDPSNRRDLALAYIKAGDRAAAAREYLKAGDRFMQLKQPTDARSVYEYALSLNAAGPVDAVHLQVRLASLHVNDGRINAAVRLLREAAATARSSGQDAVAEDVEATIQALSGERR